MSGWLAALSFLANRPKPSMQEVSTNEISAPQMQNQESGFLKSLMQYIGSGSGSNTGSSIFDRMAANREAAAKIAAEEAAKKARG